MSIGQKSFLFFLCFLAGVSAVSFNIDLMQVVLGTAFLFLVLMLVAIYRKDSKFLIAGILMLAIIAGGVYVRVYVRNVFEAHPFAMGQRIVSGVVDSIPQKTAKSQAFIIKNGNGQRIFVRTDPFRSFKPGDNVILEGEAKPLDQTAQYLKSQRVLASLFFPTVISVAPGNGFSIKRSLSFISDGITGVFYKTLGNDQAALMAGILLGQQSADFASDFKQAMKNSGTTHLVALSGYNITILIDCIFVVLTAFFSRKKTLWLAIIIIVLFVVMTGAQSSVVRAAIMGVMAVIAPYLNRVFSFRHAMAGAAFFMALANPLVIRFDAGFSLSFLSLFGITYVAPVIQSLGMFRGRWLTGLWKIFSQTVAAQIMVLPLLVVYFGRFSLAGFVSNILILPLTPLVMAFGFLQSIIGLAWESFGRILSLGLSAILSYEVGIIRVFGSFAPLVFSMGIGSVAVYYGAIAIVIRKLKSRIYARDYTA